MDKIIIKDLKYECHLGITEKERENKQTIILDIEIKTPQIKSDSIENTTNYSDLAKTIKPIIENNKSELIESLAETVTQTIQKNFNTPEVKLTLKKPNAIINASYAAIEIKRKKDE